eukprot:6081901-Amphidinium_carterae.2
MVNSLCSIQCAPPASFVSGSPSAAHPAVLSAAHCQQWKHLMPALKQSAKTAHANTPTLSAIDICLHLGKRAVTHDFRQLHTCIAPILGVSFDYSVSCSDCSGQQGLEVAERIPIKHQS